MQIHRLQVPLSIGEPSFQWEDVPFHAKSIETTQDLLKTGCAGLTQTDAETRHRECGKNEITGAEFQSPRQIFLHQFKRVMIYLLFGAAFFSFSLHETITGIALLVAVILNVLLNMLTQQKAQQSALGMESFHNTFCTVKREKQTRQIPCSELVPGDLLIFSSGQLLPADARIIASQDLQVDESLLTGESVLVRKDAEALHIPDEEVTQQSNMIFAGTRVKTGAGEAYVTAIAAHTVMGKIAHLSGETHKRETPFTRELNKLSFLVFLGVLTMVIAMVTIESARGVAITGLMQFGLIILIASIPEALPSVATFVFSTGMERLARKKVFIKNLHALESLGCATVICTDKTGTLTENALSLSQVFLPELGILGYQADWGDAKGIPCRSVEELLRIARLNNTTVLGGIRGMIVGDPIDSALYRSAPGQFESGYRRVKELPFDPATLRMATINKLRQGDTLSMIKGAPEAVIEVCTHYMRPSGDIAPLSQELRNEFLLINQDLALDGALRVIGFARKELLSENDEPYEGATFVGWACLVDPPRAGIKEAIRHCQEAGVRLIMITGDQKATAAITAKDLGIMSPHDDIWTRRDLDHGVQKIPREVRVFARTKPDEKLAIVESLQTGGEVVAMVGDGVNDAPALHKSDIAIAMGTHGAEAAKESADILLLNDRFEGLVQSILESRILTHNVKLCVEYLLSCNLSIALLILGASLVGKGMPLNTVQVLWLNMITVTLPALSLAFEPPNPMLLKRPIPSHRQGLLNRDQLSLVIFRGILVMAAGLGVYLTALLGLKASPAVAGTLTFYTVALGQLSNLFNIQFVYSGLSLPRFWAEMAKVPLTWLVVGASLLLQVATVYVPFLQFALGTTSINPAQWLLPAGFLTGMFFVSMLMIQVEGDG